MLECSQEVGPSHDDLLSLDQVMETIAAVVAPTTRRLFLYALAEHVKSNQQRNKREYPAGNGKEVTVFHAITLFRTCESGRHRARPLDYASSIPQITQAVQALNDFFFGKRSLPVDGGLKPPRSEEGVWA